MVQPHAPGPLDPLLEGLQLAVNAVFGVSEAHASGGSPYTPVWVERGCWVANPDEINHFTLYDAIPNADWKGCVEARPEPFDVTDAAPNRRNPDTLFVPTFWPDDNDTGGRHNNWMDDNPDQFPGTNYRGQGWGRTLSVYKYDGDAGNIENSPPRTRGPNMNCPTPILPLTDRRQDVLDAVSRMRHWLGGGTVSSEGLAWGWRVLSPTVPFTEGDAYDASNKVIVLMTDGLNWVSRSPNDVFRTDYSAYNALGLWLHFWPGSGPRIRSPEAFADYLDGRMEAVCENAKREGIEVYTIVFREPDARTRRLLRACATSDDHAFTADNDAELLQSFAAIAQSIAALRLTR
jgi:hypothetical protein